MTPKPERRPDADLPTDSPAPPMPWRRSNHVPTTIVLCRLQHLYAVCVRSSDQPRSQRRLRRRSTNAVSPTNAPMLINPRPDADQPRISTASQRRLRLQRRPTKILMSFATPFEKFCQHTNAPMLINPCPDDDKPTMLLTSWCRLHLRLWPTEFLTPFTTPFNQPSLRPDESKTDQRPNTVRVRGTDQRSSLPVQLTKVPTSFAPRSPNRDW